MNNPLFPPFPIAPGLPDEPIVPEPAPPPPDDPAWLTGAGLPDPGGLDPSTRLVLDAIGQPHFAGHQPVPDEGDFGVAPWTGREIASALVTDAGNAVHDPVARQQGAEMAEHLLEDIHGVMHGQHGARFGAAGTGDAFAGDLSDAVSDPSLAGLHGAHHEQSAIDGDSPAFHYPAEGPDGRLHHGHTEVVGGPTFEHQDLGHSAASHHSGEESHGDVRFGGVQVCPYCLGEGFCDWGGGPRTCGLCEGTGQVPLPSEVAAEPGHGAASHESRDASHGEVRFGARECSYCLGDGICDWGGGPRKCGYCDGTGRVP